MDNKLKLLDTKPDEMLAAIDQLRRQLPALIEHAEIIAKIRRAAYLAYIEQGFTPEEALVLCQSMTL